jgi:selenocysteine-specific elongation factor
MIVIGTSGHIDHGKSSIIKRLTGTDPDRLPEEQERGMTIDLGFAFLETANGTIGFVDVPGHERFVRNMIAGAGGMDSVMLVVAADDGWMPQSEEHFQIVRLLGVRHGVIVINKIDLAQSDWLELLETDIRNRVSDSVFHQAKVFRVSAATGVGFDALKTYLSDLAGTLASKRDIGKARLPIDRSFVQQGIGGVVTGTLRGGALSTGQPVSVWPSMVTGKIRSLQSHNEQVSTAAPSQRTAIGFTGIERESLVRGGIVSDRLDLRFHVDHPILAISAELLKGSSVDLEDRRRILILSGTTEMEGEVRLYDRGKLTAGEQGIIFIKPDMPLYTHIGDHVIIRLPTPMLTLGGGVVIDHLSHLPRRREIVKYGYLPKRVPLKLDSLILSELEKLLIADSGSLLYWSEYASLDIETELTVLVKTGKVVVSEKLAYNSDTLKAVWPLFAESVTKEFIGSSHLRGFTAEQLGRLWRIDKLTAERLCRVWSQTGNLTQEGDMFITAGRSAQLTGAVKLAYESIMNQLRDTPYTPPSLESLAAGGKPNRDAIRFILDNNLVHKCGSEFLFETKAWNEITMFIVQHLSVKPNMTVNDLKERFTLTRKHTIPILEETDRLQLTRREGDIRVKGARFDANRIS